MPLTKYFPWCFHYFPSMVHTHTRKTYSLLMHSHIHAHMHRHAHSPDKLSWGGNDAKTHPLPQHNLPTLYPCHVHYGQALEWHLTHSLVIISLTGGERLPVSGHMLISCLKTHYSPGRGHNKWSVDGSKRLPRTPPGLH